MKETIAKRNKTSIVIMLAISVFAILICILNMTTQPNLKVLFIVGICIFGISALISLVLLIDQRGMIVRRDNQLVVRLGLFKKAGIKISDIKDVYLTPNPKNPNQVLGDAITIKFAIKKKQGQLDCGSLKDAPAVVEKIKSLMGK